MIFEPKGWIAECDGVDGDICFAKICTDNFDYEEVEGINSEDAFEKFIARHGWTVVDGKHYCHECAKKQKEEAK